MRWFLIVLAPLVAALLGCTGKPAGQSSQGASTPATDRLRAVTLTAADWQTALPREYPPVLREGMTDEQLARDVELQVWAFEYQGGPLRCWLEFAESGQQTMPPRVPARDGWACDATTGRFVFSVGRGASARMKRIMQQLGKDAYPESITFNLRFRSPGEGQSGSFGTSHDGAPLWFGWPGEKQFTVRAVPVATAREGEAFTILRVECTEPAPADRKAAPRHAALLLKGVFGKPSKE